LLKKSFSLSHVGIEPEWSIFTNKLDIIIIGFLRAVKIQLFLS